MPSPVPSTSRRIGSLLATCAVAVVTSAPSRAATGGPDAFGYAWHDVNSGCAVEPGAFALENSGTFVQDTFTRHLIGPIELGIAFPFYDRVVTQAWLHQFSIVFFEPPPEASRFASTWPIPSAGDGASGFLAPWWTWMLHGAGTDAWWESHPDAGTFLLSLSQREDLGSSATPLRTQVILHRNGDIRMEYTVLGSAVTATIGMEAHERDQARFDGLSKRQRVGVVGVSRRNRPFPDAGRGRRWPAGMRRDGP